MKQENEWDDVCSKLKIGSLKRHVFLCTGPKCASEEKGFESWSHLKIRLKEENLGTVYRTKVGCLRICKKGPIGLIYPEGTWYHSLSPANIERVISNDLVGQELVSDLLIAQDDLSS